MSSNYSEFSRPERERLIEAHLPLVRSVARRYAGRGETLEDLIQVGSIGLIKSSARFDPARGVAFATFATPAIEGEIRRHLAERTSSLRLPRRLQRMSAQVRRHSAELTARLGRSPTPQELAADLSADESEIASLLDAERAHDSIAFTTSDGADSEAPDPQSLVDSDDRLLLAGSVQCLDERERRIVFLRFHADMTESEIGRELGVSQAHVSRLLAAALSKLRAEMAATGDVSPADITAAEAISQTPEVGAVEARLEHEANAQPGGDGETRIAAVGPEENRSVAHFLELPHHVAVRSKRQSGRSWWTATVEELPGCAAEGSTPDEAVRLLRSAKETWVRTALEQGRPIPVPGSVTKAKDRSGHSGRFLVRMPGALHAELATAAEREDISLNRFVTEALARAVAPPADAATATVTLNAAVTADATATPDPTETPAATETSAATETPAITETPAATDTAAAAIAEQASPPPKRERLRDSVPADAAGASAPVASSEDPAAPRQPARALQVALATNLVVVVVAALVAVALFILALQRGI
ncbi:MAG: sigma-70 family RNA polymerase sigma factor [Solirubrobacterales bacterium]|nr:sigma-70 family RNA polymerase sigma factor [Solirubrobacterales bacterium]